MEKKKKEEKKEGEIGPLHSLTRVTRKKKIYFFFSKKKPSFVPLCGQIAKEKRFFLPNLGLTSFSSKKKTFPKKEKKVGGAEEGQKEE